jgi:hypothetical protein
MSEPKPKHVKLFALEAPAPTAPEGRALLEVVQLPGGDLGLGLEDGGHAIAVRLDPAAAFALGVALLAATREVLAAQAAPAGSTH